VATVDVLAARVAQALRPFAYAAQSEDGVRDFVAELGWTLPRIPPSLVGLREGFARLHEVLGDLVVERRRAESGAGQDDVDGALARVAAELALIMVDVHSLPARLRAELPADFVAATRIDRDFDARLFDSLLSLDLARNSAVTYRLLRLAGVVELTGEAVGADVDPAAFAPHRIRWDRLFRLLEPAALAREVYGWGTPAIDGSRLFAELVPLSLALGMPAELRYADAPFGERPALPAGTPAQPSPQLWIPLLRAPEAQLFIVVGLLRGVQAGGPQGLALTIVPSAAGDQVFPLGDALEVAVEATAQLGTGAALVLRPDRPPAATLDAGGPGSALTNARVGTSLIWNAPDWETAEGITAAGGNSITARRVAVGLGAEATRTATEVFAELVVEDGKLVVGAPAGDGFLGSLLPAEGLVAPFSFALRWSRAGLTFRGSAGLATTIPLVVRAGPLEVRELDIAFRGDEGRFVAEAAVSASVRLGPIELAIDRIGLAALAVGTPGNLGPVDLDVAFKPPSGAGIAIEAELVKGGGFLSFDEARRTYGGALELVVAGRLAVKAFGLLTVRSDGYSLIVVLSAEFPEPINLPFGWRLSGVGGVLGLHHRLDVAALQAGLRTGVAEQLLFPPDPVASAPRILGTLGTVFPPARGQFLVGPLLRLFWGERGLASLSVALILESPDPTRVLILGRLVVTAPHQGFELLVLRAEFAGVIDFERPSFEFDAAISDSRLGPYALSGDVAVRIRGGEGGLFLLTAGGFHPRFPVPTNASLPPLRRIAVALSSGDNPRARLELYTAITASTWQIGGKLDVSASAAGFTAEAQVSVDAIFGEIREDGRTRCGFVVEIEGRAAIRRGGTTIAGVGLTITLTGTEPWRVKGKARISFFLFSVSIPFEGTFGDEPDRPELPLVDAAALLRTALAERASWETGLPADAGPLVTLAGRAVDGDVLVAHPLGRLAVRQHAVPLEVDVARIGGARTAPDRYQVSSVRLGTETPPRTPLRSQFAAGQFLDLTEDERFARPAFEPMISGFEVTSASTSVGPPTAADLGYEEIAIGPAGPLEEPRPGRPPLASLLGHASALGAAGTSSLRRDEHPARQRAASATVRVTDVGPVVADARTLRRVDLPGVTAGAAFTEVAQTLSRHVASGAATADSLVLVAAHESAG
jgi:hypothetical protein